MNRYARALGWLHGAGSWWAVVIGVWITVDVVSRAFFNRPIQGTAEWVAYSLPFVTFLQIAHILRERRHLRSPLIGDFVGERARAGLAVPAYLLGIALFLLCAYAVWRPMWTAWRDSESVGDGVVEIPSGPLWSVIFLGCALMAVEFAIALAAAARMAFDKRSDDRA